VGCFLGELVLRLESNKNKLLKIVRAILNGRIKDPMQWQRDIRRESDRDIYGDFSK